jgi:rhodanese-related sulfurtransferase
VSEVPRISREELKERLDDGEDIVIFDTRGKVPYDFEHIAGAIWPAKANPDEFPHDQEIVIYCT